MVDKTHTDIEFYNKVFEPVSSTLTVENPHPPLYISRSFSCPNLPLRSFFEETYQETKQETHSTQPVFTTRRTSWESGLGETQYKPAWRRLLSKEKSRKLLKRPLTCFPKCPARLTNPGQISSSRSIKRLPNVENDSRCSVSALPVHLRFLNPLDSNGLPSPEEKMAPFTGGLNRDNPVWQNIELKRKLAGLGKEKKRADDYSRRYKILEEEFENLRQTSETTRMDLQNDNLKKDNYLIAYKDEASRQRKFAEHWEWLYEREVAKFVFMKAQLDGAIFGHPPDSDTLAPGCPTELGSEASAETREEDAILLASVRKNSQSSQSTSQKSFGSSKSITADSESEIESTPPSPRRLHELRSMVTSILKDVLMDIDGIRQEQRVNADDGFFNR